MTHVKHDCASLCNILKQQMTESWVISETHGWT